MPYAGLPKWFPVVGVPGYTVREIEDQVRYLLRLDVLNHPEVFGASIGLPTRGRFVKFLLYMQAMFLGILIATFALGTGRELILGGSRDPYVRDRPPLRDL